MKSVVTNLSAVSPSCDLFFFEGATLPQIGDEFIYRNVGNFRKSVEGIVYVTGKRMNVQLRQDFENGAL